MTEYALYISHRFSTLDIDSYTHVLLCHTIRVHTISLKKESMCVLTTGISDRCAHVFYVSVPACCYSRIMPDHTWHVLPLNTCQNNVNVMDDWPALSADLNPTEHCWDYLKKRIRKLQLNNVRDLQNAIRREWQRLPLCYIRYLVRSMRWRCKSVFRINGWHTRYGTYKSVIVNDDFHTVKILRVCLFRWMVFNNEMKFLCLCTINLLDYELKVELLNFRQNLNSPTENDSKVKLAFLMALSILNKPK